MQNSNRICTDFKKEITKIITDKRIFKIIDEEVSCYIEICTLFDSLFSLSRTPYGEINDVKLEENNIRYNYVKHDEVKKSKNVDANYLDTWSRRSFV